MDFPRPSMSASELFGDLKDKLGFGGGRSDRRDDYYDDPYYDDYADPEPAQGPYDSGYDPDTYGDPYDRLEYTTRSTGSSRSAGSRSSRFSSAQLVSSGDIRATTSAYGVSDVAAKPTMELPSVSHRTEAEEKKSVSKIAEDFSIPASSYTDFVSPYKQSSSASASSSAGLDSLFAPSAAPSGSVSGSSDGANVGSAHGTSLAREIVVLKPASYEDASSIAQSVRAGKIVVLYLRQTDPALSKRILDFSFGVASALTAQVDCLAEKTFVVLQGKELTLEEKHNLAKQGVLKS